jgi:DNA-directed RNA polymerase specialized sigma24 family protein
LAVALGLKADEALEGDEVEELVEVAPLPDALLAEAEEHHRLTGCVATPKQVQRAVLVARLFGGDSGRETATRLGMTPRNVAVVLHRARKRHHRVRLPPHLPARASRS